MIRSITIRYLLLFILVFTACSQNPLPDPTSTPPPQSQDMQKHRMIVLSDIEADPDDAQTLVRLLLYSNVIDLEGLVATTSTHQKSRVAPESMRKIIHAYGQVQPNLLKHEAGFPTEGQLLALVTQGLPEYGMLGVGEGKDSEGSERIIQALEKDDDRPLWISVWGGVNTLAQALFKIEGTRSKEEAASMISKLRVYTISDQDDSGIWIRNNFPELFYIVSPGGYVGATWIAITQPVSGISNEEISNSWLADHIQQGHGPLGAMYPDVAYGMEGDTPSWLALIPNGLSVPDRPDWGGWGGRYELYQPELSDIDKSFTGGVPIDPETRPIWTNTSDSYRPWSPQAYRRAVSRDTTVFSGNRVTLWRWRKDFQNDFAARMDWSTMNYEEANHPPIPALGHSEEFSVISGETFSLDASGTTDPDGDNLSYLWFHYPEAGTLKETIQFGLAENLYNVHTIRAPEVQDEETAHFILKVTDKGEPPLSRYKRVIVTIQPK